MSRNHRQELGRGSNGGEINLPTLLQREFPKSQDAEESVIGSILLDPNVNDNVCQIINTDDFYDDSLQIVFRHIQEMRNSGNGIDTITLRQALVASGEYETIGGAARLAKLFTQVPTPAHAVHYANIVRDKSIKRGMIAAVEEIATQCYEDRVGGQELLEQGQSSFFSLADRFSSAVQLKIVGDELEPHVEHLDDLRMGRVDTGITTGLSELDNYLQFRPAELTVLGARPSQGKSALALNIAEHVTCRLNHPTTFVSLEMSTRELLNRFLASRTNLNLIRFQHGAFSVDDMGTLRDAAAHARNSPLSFIDSTSLTVSKIASVVRQNHRAGNCRLLVIDYVQLIKPEKSNDTREQQVAKISRSLKELARELSIPVLILAQVKRDVGDAGRPPKLSDLRESGAIEQDADNVFFVHRPEYYRMGSAGPTGSGVDSMNSGERAELHIAKQRNGPTGVVETVYLKSICKFTNAAERRYDELADDGDDVFGGETQTGFDDF